MSNTLRHRTVAVAVIYDRQSQSFLLCHNKRWHGYAFPMKHFEPETGVDAAEIALRAVADADFPLDLPNALASPADRHGECEFSEGVHQYTFYDYHVFDIDPGQPIGGNLPDPDLRWFTFDELMSVPSVTWSTRSIAETLVEDRKVAVAVISKPGPGGPEFLLVFTQQYQYFFPASRMKTSMLPAQGVLQAVHVDLAYGGNVKVLDQIEVPDIQRSQRYGPHLGRFHFHLCHLDLSEEVDVSVPGNVLEQGLDELQQALIARHLPGMPAAYWGWFSEKDLRTRRDISPSMQAVMLTALRFVEGTA